MPLPTEIPKPVISYSVVVPVFNASGTIDDLTERIYKSLSELGIRFEIIFVDDGSTDNSWKAICDLKEKYPESLIGIRLSKNYGQHNATFCGMIQAKGNRIITIDDDIEAQPEDIPSLIQKMNEDGVDLVYGIPTNKKYGPIRSVFTGIFKTFQKTEGQEKGKGSSFRLISENLKNGIKQNAHNFVFIDEICLWYTNKIAFLPLSFSPSAKGKSSYTISKLLRLTFDLVLFSSVTPLRLITILGFFFALFNFLFGLRFIWRKYAHDVPLGYSSIIVSILFSTGLILLCLGVLGEYLNKVYQMQKQEPLYNINKII